jgi:predicted dehydrogenase
MNNVRLGVIGLGNIGQRHAAAIASGQVKHAELIAVANPSPEKLKEFGRLKTFTDGGELIRSGLVDAVIIATPHFQHTTLGIAALERGLHVMVEKPIAAHKTDAERLLAAHVQRSQLVFAAMFQLRAEPRYLNIRSRLQNDELGKVVRVNWIMTDWFRTEAYYASSEWRATWKGEGGGVLLNQCLHNLDVLHWLLGPPARLRGFCQLGRFHRIEVEDNVSAYFEYPNGATGVFVSSTGEAPGTNRLEIAGTRGRLVLDSDRLTFTRNEQDMSEFGASSPLGFGKPETRTEEIPIEEAAAPHAMLLQNFVNAIREGEPLIAPGHEGIHSVELANAILYSSLVERTIDLPLDGAAFEKKLNELIATSTLRKRPAGPAVADFSSSFRK